jgi:hypothetical protein
VILTAVTKTGYLIFDIGIKKREKKLLDLLIRGVYSLFLELLKKTVIYIKRRAAAIFDKFPGSSAEMDKITIGQAGAVIIRRTENILQLIINEFAGEIHTGLE